MVERIQRSFAVIAFYEALQLESDQSEDEAETLNEMEELNLKKLMSFSSLTSNSLMDTQLAFAGAKYGKIAANLLADLNNRYADSLKMLNAKFDLKECDDWMFKISANPSS